MRAGCFSSHFRLKTYCTVYFVTAVVSLSLVLIYKRSFGHVCHELGQGDEMTRLKSRMPVPARIFNYNRNYNLMDETGDSIGFGKLKQYFYFNIYNKECTLSDYFLK
jgi:hypothetical protein